MRCEDPQPVHRDGQPLFTRQELSGLSQSRESNAATGPEARRHPPDAGSTSHESAARAEPQACNPLPPHALHVWLPISDNYSLESGATCFYLGSHHSFGEHFEDLPREEREQYPKAQPVIAPGSALVFDDRVFHYGGENRSSEVRTCIFYSFARPFFTDGTLEADRDTTAWTEIE